ncbi:antitoxin MazE-like protein [Burkholderia cenocepacia]|uniref:antitoxin MazE-like protein n=1 Tax=Burkholderia cenocepacia TaxID=95486 RepID=UPI0021185A27|nr:antitoxin MazE-like protein [Burkholderia cenocepacia]
MQLEFEVKNCCFASCARANCRGVRYRPARFRMIDTDSPAFAAMLRRQCHTLHGDPAEADAIGVG